MRLEPLTYNACLQKLLHEASRPKTIVRYQQMLLGCLDFSALLARPGCSVGNVVLTSVVIAALSILRKSETPAGKTKRGHSTFGEGSFDPQDKAGGDTS